MKSNYYTQSWFVCPHCCFIRLFWQESLDEHEYDLFERLRGAQRAVGDTNPLIVQAKQVEADKRSSTADNIGEESKTPSSKASKPRKAEFEEVLEERMKVEGWDHTIDQMWRGVPGHDILSDNRLHMSLWQSIVKKELEAASRTGYVPRYLRAIYNERFPPTSEELGRRCPICWEVCSKVANTQRHMTSYHGKKDVSLKTFFRQEAKEGCSERNKWF